MRPGEFTGAWRKIMGGNELLMNRDEFWSLIDDSWSEASSNEEFIAALRANLVRCLPAEILEFDHILSECLAEIDSYDTWALAYIVRDGCTENEYDSFCSWIVAQGREGFELAKADLVAFARHADFSHDPQLVELMDTAYEAYEEAAGKEPPLLHSALEEMPGEPWSEEDLPTRYPELWRMFREGGG